jgi:RimJ/RimL family protein N-acetyltransferase
MHIGETERLILREMTPEDAANLYLLNSDPDVIRYTGDPPFRDIQDAENMLIHYEQYRKYGIGRWAVNDKFTNEFLGWCGLKYSEDSNEYDIGYRFFRKFWNKGYATESAGYCLQLGFKKFHIETILGRAMKANAASIRVFEKIGMSYLKDSGCGGSEGVIYIANKKTDENSAHDNSH